MPLIFSRNDITKMRVDAIVNAANTNLQAGGGVCGAIFRAAGLLKLQHACNKLAPIKTGEAVITPGFEAIAKFIIHTAGPIYQSGNSEQETLLYNCYYNSLKIAKQNRLKSIAFPLISAGIYGYPPYEVIEIAVKAISDFIGSDFGNDMFVYLVIFDNQALNKFQPQIAEISDFIDKSFVRDTNKRGINNSKKSGFYDLFFDYMIKNNQQSSDIYKKSNLETKLFTQIVSNKNFNPDKNTILALSIAMQLDYDDTVKMLETQGYSFDNNSKADIITEYYIKHHNQNYNIYHLNCLLFDFKQIQLGQNV